MPLIKGFHDSINPERRNQLLTMATETHAGVYMFSPRNNGFASAHPDVTSDELDWLEDHVRVVVKLNYENGNGLLTLTPAVRAKLTQL